jgi:hypothetical protein
MLQNFTIVSLSQDQAIVLLAETIEAGSTLDGGSVQTTVCRHPEIGELILVQNALGTSAVALDKAQIPALSDWLSPSVTH